jgi:hypothetical protein
MTNRNISSLSTLLVMFVIGAKSRRFCVQQEMAVNDLHVVTRANVQIIVKCMAVGPRCEISK